MKKRSRRSRRRPAHGATANDNERSRILHELRTHQVELEAQNEELRKTRSLLEESRDRYADLYDLAPIVYLTLDRRCRIVDANLQASSLLGFEKTRLIGRYLPAFMRATDPRQLRRHLDDCLAQGSRVSGVMELSPLGEEIIAQIVSVAVRDEHGRVVGCRLTLTDISAGVRSQESLRVIAAVSRVLSWSLESVWPTKEVLRLLIPSVADVALIELLDDDGRLRLLDAATKDAESFGPLLERPAGRSRSALATPQATVLSTGKPLLLRDCAGETLSAQGIGPSFLTQLRAQSAMFVPLPAAGSTIGVMTLISRRETRRYSTVDLEVAVDIASRIGATIDNGRLYRTAQMAVAARERTLAILSHDLQNPLMSIALMLDTLLADPRIRRFWGGRRLRQVREATSQVSRVLRGLVETPDWSWRDASDKAGPETPVGPLAAAGLQPRKHLSSRPHNRRDGMRAVRR